MDMQTYFGQRAALFAQSIHEVEQQLARVAWLRLLVVVVGIVLEVFAFRAGGGWWLAALVPPLVGFALLVKWNARIARRKQFLGLLKTINAEEPGRLNGNAPKGAAMGQEFETKEHPYASDLDLFGARSLFALLDRTATVFGRRTLAAWLLQPASGSIVESRQTAALELAPQIDFRQEFQAEGRMPGIEEASPEHLKDWVSQAPVVSVHPVYPWVRWVLPPLTVAAIVVSILGWVPALVPVGFLLLHAILNRGLAKHSRRVYYQTDKQAQVLLSYAALLKRIDTAKWEAPLLQGLQARVATEGRPAHTEIKALASILQRLELRLNGLVYGVLNTLFFWDIHALIDLEKWKAAHGLRLHGWFEVLGEMEALAGIAAVYHGRPDWAKPELVNEGFVLDGEAVGHPLIPDGQRVPNPVELNGQGLAWLVTGSNMSGKSTYLRTVGVNALLALVGAPVCAKSFRVSPMQIAASMRTADSLEENTSSFYAELKRIHQVIAMVGEGRPTLFLLDEILKGTNSKDRHAGARALIRQLIAAGGTGLVSTHDLELQDLAAELPGQAYNYSFNCDVSPEGKLDFDYQLRSGVCQSMNATALMRAMGIAL